MENENKVFSTRDIYLASTLMTLEFKLQGIDYQVEGNRNLPVGYFLFDETKELLKANTEYWQGSIKIEPMMFINNMRSLKSQIHTIYKSPHVDHSKFSK